MFRFFFLLIFVFCSCAPQKAKVEKPERLPITEQARELAKLPPYVLPAGNGVFVAIEKGDESPMPGILIDEETAMLIADLRISYDEVYRMAETDRKYLLTVIQIQEEELHRADREILGKDLTLRKIRDSWWEQNKFGVGTTLGIVVGIAVAIGVGKVWAEIEENQ